MTQTKTKSSSITAYTWFQVFVACLSLFALGWMDNARGPFFPLFIENTSTTATKGSLFFALASFTAIVTSALASFIIRTFGLKFLLALSGIMMGLSPFGLVFMPNLTGSLITALLFGGSLGFVAVGQNVLIGLIEDPKFRKRFFALLHCFYALAAMFAPISILWLREIFKWNELLLGVTFLAAPFVFFVFFLRKDRPSEKKKESKLTPSWSDRASFLWVFYMSFYVSSELILTTRMVVLSQSLGSDFSKASMHLFYFFLCMFVSRFFFFLVNVPIRETYVLMACMIGGVFSFVLGFLQDPIFLAFVGAFMGPVYPLVMEALSHKWPKYFDTMVSRVISLSSLFVVVAHMGVGRLTDTIGIERSMSIVPIFLILSFFVLSYKVVKRY